MGCAYDHLLGQQLSHLFDGDSPSDIVNNDVLTLQTSTLIYTHTCNREQTFTKYLYYMECFDVFYWSGLPLPSPLIKKDVDSAPLNKIHHLLTGYKYNLKNDSRPGDFSKSMHTVRML